MKKAVDAAAKIDAKRKLPKGQQTLSFSKPKKATRVSPPPPAPVATVAPPSPPELPTPSAFGAYAFAE